MMHRPPTEIEFRDLSVCAQKYYRDRYPKRDFGEGKRLEYGKFFCGGYLPNGTQCMLEYGMRFQVEACRKWHDDQAEKSKASDILKV